MASQAYQLLSDDIILFADSFNEPLDTYMNILETVKIVQLGSNFNQSINNLPDNIEFIIWLNPQYTGTISKLPANFKKVYYKSTSLDDWMNIQNLLINVMAENEQISEPFDITTFDFETARKIVNETKNKPKEPISEDTIGYNKSNGMYYGFL